MGGPQPSALFCVQAAPARAPVVLKLPERAIGAIRRLGDDDGEDLQKENNDRNEDIMRFRFHLFQCNPGLVESCVAMWKWSLVISFRQA